MKTRTFVLLYFKTVKATQSTQGKKIYSAKKSQHAAKENEFTPEQKKNAAAKKKKKKKKKPGKFIGSRLCKLF